MHSSSSHVTFHIYKATFAIFLLVLRTAANSTNLYQILGLPRSATPSQIKKAYRKLALQHHPDKVPESQRSAAEHKFKEIGKAYEWLSDDKKKQLYDRYGERSLDPNFQPGFFDAAPGANQRHWGTSAGGTRTQYYSTGPTAEGDAGIPRGIFRDMPGFSAGGVPADFGNFDLNDIIRHMMGGVPMAGTSPRAMGEGSYYARERQDTDASHGFSSFGNQYRSKPPPPKEYVRPIYCSLEDICMGCTKKIKVSFPLSGEKLYTINIRPGWKQGTKIKFSTMRSENPFGMEVEYPPITFVMHEKKHPYLERIGNDLYWKCKLTKSQAEKGAKLHLPLPDGSVLEVTSEKGTKSGKQITIPGRGIPAKNKKKGNVVIEFIVDS